MQRIWLLNLLPSVSFSFFLFDRAFRFDFLWTHQIDATVKGHALIFALATRPIIGRGTGHIHALNG